MLPALFFLYFLLSHSLLCLWFWISEHQIVIPPNLFHPCLIKGGIKSDMYKHKSRTPCIMFPIYFAIRFSLLVIILFHQNAKDHVTCPETSAIQRGRETSLFTLHALKNHLRTLRVYSSLIVIIP